MSFFSSNATTTSLTTDSSILSFGTDSDVSLTHVHNTGLLLNSSMAIQFNDASQYIHAPSNAILDINATDEIKLNATLCDINANLDVSGNFTTGGNIVIPDAGTIGSASDTNAISIGSNGVVNISSTEESNALTVGGGLGVAKGISVAPDTDDVILTLATARPWSFKTSGTAQNADLRLKSHNASKYLHFEHPNNGVTSTWCTLRWMDASNTGVHESFIHITQGFFRVSGTITSDTAVIDNSDRRIKDNIVDIDDSVALQQVRDIPCRNYTYKDTNRRGTDSTPGFIAQEVESVYPIAVSTHTDCIPNEYRLLTDYTLVETTTLINPTNTDKGYYWKLTVNDLTDLSTTNKYTFTFSNDTTFDYNTGRNDTVLLECIDGEPNSFLVTKQWTHIFLYGKEVTDFKRINKAKIFTLHHSAIQQLDTTLTAEQLKIVTLESKVTTLETEVDTLKTELAAIKTHLGL